MHLPTPSEFEVLRLSPRLLFNFRWLTHCEVFFNVSLMKKKITHPHSKLFFPVSMLKWMLPSIRVFYSSETLSTCLIPFRFPTPGCLTLFHCAPDLYYAFPYLFVLQKWTAKPAYLFNNFSSIPVSVYRQNNTSTNCTHSSLKTLSQTGKLKVDPGAPACLQAPSIRLFTRQKDIYPKVSGVLIAPLSTPYLHQNMLSPDPTVIQPPECNPTLNATFHVPPPP
jgi:hypothetical protein